jgi:GNAT acetyltransferase-like protein
MIRALGDDLVLREATSADEDALSAFVGDVLRAQDSDQPSRPLAAWVRDLIGGRHPTFRPGDATVVVDRRTGSIVSCLHLLSHTWAYGGIPIVVGQPELIGTLPERRGGGLVRAQFEVIHRWSAERGHLMQAITGIPWFYRQFGYEMAIERGGGPRVRRDPLVPLPAPPPGWRLRPAVEADVAFVASLSAAAGRRALLSVPRDAALWRYELTGKRPDSAARREIRILERDGERVGYLAHAIELWGDSLNVSTFEVASGVSWREAWLTALPGLFEAGDALAGAGGRGRCEAVSLWLLGSEHPLYGVARFPERDDGYAWYARVPDVATFLRSVSPALERRLAASSCAGHTGTLTLGFFTDGVRLQLARGKIVGIEGWRPDITVRGLEFGRPSTDSRRPLAMFPDLTFLQLLLGFRSLPTLENAFPDCVVRTNEARALLGALFPPAPSDLWPVT